ncbi:MAG: glucose-1-phosphate thymidylyltransferase, partial [Spirochaetes bacterium]
GDNIFYGHSFPDLLGELSASASGAAILGYHVQDPERFGVVEFNKEGQVISLEEKPENPKSDYAVVGLYFYNNSVVDIAMNLKPSPRGELEITDVNKVYLEKGQLSVKLMGRGYTWFDTGTQSSLMDAASFVRTIQERSGLMVGCIEEVAYRKGYISSEQLKNLGEKQGKSSYGEYLVQIAQEESLGL